MVETVREPLARFELFIRRRTAYRITRIIANDPRLDEKTKKMIVTKIKGIFDL
jgi:hypothetical protein